MAAIAKWEPQADITTYELALCVGILIMSVRNELHPRLPSQLAQELDELPAEAKRHFVRL